MIEAIEELSIPDNADVRFDDPLEETLSVTLIFKDSDQADVFQKEIERLAAEQDFQRNFFVLALDSGTMKARSSAQINAPVLKPWSARAFSILE